MSIKCETVRVKADNDDGYKVINLADLTEKDMLWEPSPEKPKAAQRKKSVSAK